MGGRRVFYRGKFVENAKGLNLFKTKEKGTSEEVSFLMVAGAGFELATFGL